MRLAVDRQIVAMTAIVSCCTLVNSHYSGSLFSCSNSPYSLNLTYQYFVFAVASASYHQFFDEFCASNKPIVFVAVVS